jgi:hypothetical protein
MTFAETADVAHRKFLRRISIKSACWFLGVSCLSYLLLSSYTSAWMPKPDQLASTRSETGVLTLSGGGRSSYASSSYIGTSKVVCSFSPYAPSYACNGLRDFEGIQVTAKIAVLQSWFGSENLILEIKNQMSGEVVYKIKGFESEWIKALNEKLASSLLFDCFLLGVTAFVTSWFIYIWHRRKYKYE